MSKMQKKNFVNTNLEILVNTWHKKKSKILEYSISWGQLVLIKTSQDLVQIFASSDKKL